MNKNLYPIIDCHCDLLSYLDQDLTRGPFDRISRASYPQLHEGGVRLQTLAIFALTQPGSAIEGEKQLNIFLKLLKEYPKHFVPYAEEFLEGSKQIQLIAAIENAMAFIDEKESLEEGLRRLEVWHEALGNIFYISLTWDFENRFGGGNGSNKGLTEEGKRLLEWMGSKRLALDLSHASDALAYDMINYIDKKRISLPIMASHSNFRTITDMPRNLPDEIAKEIIKRKGIIGINFFSAFSDKHHYEAIFKHIEYGFKLGAENALSFGADFFCDKDFSSLQKRYDVKDCFLKQLSDASCYQSLLDSLQKELKINDSLIKNLAFQNAQLFMVKLFA